MVPRNHEHSAYLAFKCVRNLFACPRGTYPKASAGLFGALAVRKRYRAPFWLKPETLSSFDLFCLRCPAPHTLAQGCTVVS